MFRSDALRPRCLLAGAFLALVLPLGIVLAMVTPPGPGRGRGRAYRTGDGVVGGACPGPAGCRVGARRQVVHRGGRGRRSRPSACNLRTSTEPPCSECWRACPSAPAGLVSARTISCRSARSPSICPSSICLRRRASAWRGFSGMSPVPRDPRRATGRLARLRRRRADSAAPGAAWTGAAVLHSRCADGSLARGVLQPGRLADRRQRTCRSTCQPRA